MLLSFVIVLVFETMKESVCVCLWDAYEHSADAFINYLRRILFVRRYRCWVDTLKSVLVSIRRDFMESGLCYHVCRPYPSSEPPVSY